MFRALYDWTLRLAHHRHAVRSMAAVSFAESSFFPDPAGRGAGAGGAANRDRAYWIATVCTVASVLGGVLGYAIGAFLWDSVGLWLVQLYHIEEKMQG
jgi:membrane protein YqaA with SNARE-associated domain